MRRSRKEAAQTRLQIIEAASRLFRERGIASVSIADVMASVGLTDGGFYRHFAHKEALVAEAVRAVVQTMAAPEGLTMDGFLKGYLSTEHRDHPADGCPVAALGSPMSREGPLARGAYAEALDALLATLAGVAGAPRGRVETLALAAQVVGAVVLSRAVDGPLSDEILEAARLTAVSHLKEETR